MKKDDKNIPYRGAIAGYVFLWDAVGLLAEIEDELSSLDRLVSDIEHVFEERPKAVQKRLVYDESLALKLHNFYTGCERIFNRINADLDEKSSHKTSSVSSGWHRRLLKRMSLEIEGVRPKVISQETLEALEDFLAFRHLVRNIYGYELESERVAYLVGKVGSTYKGFKKDMKDFTGFIRKAGKSSIK